jgi:alanine racemase
VAPGDDEEINGWLIRMQKERKDFTCFSWGFKEHNQVRILTIRKMRAESLVEVRTSKQTVQITIPFIDEASIENAITCFSVMIALGYEDNIIKERITHLHAIDMRMQLRHSFNDCLVVNDSYSADITSLKVALDFLNQQASGLKKTVILSEFAESGSDDDQLYGSIWHLLKIYGVRKVMAVGEKIGEVFLHNASDDVELVCYASTEDFIAGFRSSQFSKEIILIKGARRFGFERIAQLFEKKMHQTVLEINLDALAHNLKEYQNLLAPSTKLMAMVKAFSYGSGGAEIASVLQFHNVDYLGVAYADEGVDLVKAGISIPVMVMNAEESSFRAIVDYNLEPVIYSPELLHSFESYLKEQGLHSYPVHLEVDTGMNRLGFPVSSIEAAAEQISNSDYFHLRSMFTHLAASEDESQDVFTSQQVQLFEQAVEELRKHISYPFLQHISNSAAIVRHPQFQKDMVRLGIGLYGVEIDNDRLLNLQPVATLRSTIAQLRNVKAGESISYNRREIVKRDSLIATVRIGYADGYSRQFGNGRGHMLVRGKLAPVTGVVCMDMTMIDVTDIPDVKEGDDVVVFGKGLPVQQVALWANTIAYELMTSVSHRVKRIYFHE